MLPYCFFLLFTRLRLLTFVSYRFFSTTKAKTSPPPMDRSLAVVTPSTDKWISNLPTTGQCSNNGGGQRCDVQFPYGFHAECFTNSGSKTITQVKFWLSDLPVDRAPIKIVVAPRLNGQVLSSQTVTSYSSGQNAVLLSRPATVSGNFCIGIVPAQYRPNTNLAIQLSETSSDGDASRACRFGPYNPFSPPSWVKQSGSLCIEAYVGTGPSPPTPTPPTPTPPAPAPATCPIPCFCNRSIPWACFGCYFAQCASKLPGCSNAFCSG